MKFSLRQNLEYYKELQPTFDIQKFFLGSLKAWGIVQNLKGEIVQRLEIDMRGEWQGHKGQLHEDIRYFDGRSEIRTWNIEKISDGDFLGTADGIIGNAIGHASGAAMKWNYTMTIPYNKKPINVQFDDWMYAIDENHAVNRAYIKKFGIKVAEVSIFIQKINEN